MLRIDAMDEATWLQDYITALHICMFIRFI